jgi:hypothetical protein
MERRLDNMRNKICKGFISTLASNLREYFRPKWKALGAWSKVGHLLNGIKDLDILMFVDIIFHEREV